LTSKLKVKDPSAIAAISSLATDLSTFITAYNSHKHDILMATFGQRELSGVGGGTATAGSWFDIALTEWSDPGGIISISSNIINFAQQAGRYFIYVNVPGLACGHFQSRIYNYSASSSLATGQSTYSNNANAYAQVNSVVATFFITTASIYRLKIQMRCSNTKTSSGRGTPCGWGTEQYTTGFIIKLPTDEPE